MLRPCCGKIGEAPAGCNGAFAERSGALLNGMVVREAATSHRTLRPDPVLCDLGERHAAKMHGHAVHGPSGDPRNHLAGSAMLCATARFAIAASVQRMQLGQGARRFALRVGPGDVEKGWAVTASAQRQDARRPDFVRSSQRLRDYAVTSRGSRGHRCGRRGVRFVRIAGWIRDRLEHHAAEEERGVAELERGSSGGRFAELVASRRR